MYNNIKVVAFDADDTLWVNETYFRDAELEFAKLLAKYETANKIDQELFKKEIENLRFYGYGIKGFVLSMIECALELSNYQIHSKTIEAILSIGKQILNHPIELIHGVQAVLKKLHAKYKLIVATKGDLLDQERKLEKSGLLKYFHHIEVMSDKKPKDYEKLLAFPSPFLMLRLRSSFQTLGDRFPILQKLFGVGWKVILTEALIEIPFAILESSFLMRFLFGVTLGLTLWQYLVIAAALYLLIELSRSERVSSYQSGRHTSQLLLFHLSW